MKEGKHNKTRNDDRAIDDVREVDASAAEKSHPKKKIATRMVTGIAAAAVGIGIALLVSRKLDLSAMSPASAAKGAKAIADGTAKVVAQAAVPPAVETVVTEPKVVNVDWFLRKLPENRYASPDAVSYAAALGVDLAEGQTIVRPQTRLYCRAA